MAESLEAANTAFAEFKEKYPEAAIYFCFLAGFDAALKFQEAAHAV